MSLSQFRFAALLGTLCLFGCSQERSSPDTERPTAVAPAKPDAAPQASTVRRSDTEVQTPADSSAAESKPIDPPVARATTPDTVPATAADASEPAEPEVTLGIGSPAPPLALASWTKGEPVTSFEPGQIYVVEFWATWCGPCKVSMPHLSQLQKQLGESVRFIGISDEDEETVRKFLESPYKMSRDDEPSDKTWNDVVEYSLALDDAEKTNKAYMRAAGQNGIPTAFVVGKDGIIDWIGHPMAMDEPLAKIRAGEWDRAVAKAEIEEQKRAQAAMMAARTKLRTAVVDKDWAAAIAVMDDLIVQFPKNPSLKLQKLAYLKVAGREKEAQPILDEVITSSWEEPEALNEIAWGVATGSFPGSNDAALKAAQRAAELTKDGNASVLDTLARVHFERGNLDEALTIQRKAAQLDGANPEIAKALERYEAAKNPPPATDDAATKAEPPASETEGTPAAPAATP